MPLGPLRIVHLAQLALAVALAGCQGKGLQAHNNDTATIAVSQEPDNLNPLVSPMQVVSTLAPLFYSGLVTLDDHGAFIPDLAVRVPSLNNGDVSLQKGEMRVSFHLRPEARWQDGPVVTSQDVLATWRLIMNPRFPGLSRSGYDRISKIETPTPHIAVLYFKAPYAPFLELFPFILPAHEMKARAVAWDKPFVGSGPYRLESWRSGDRLVALANPTYFRKKPAIKRIVVRFVNQETTAFGLFKDNELDLLQGSLPSQRQALELAAPGRVKLTPLSTWEHVLFNLDNPILSDRRIREAIATLIDRKAIIKEAYNNVGRPAWSEVPSFSWAYDPKVEGRYPYDPARAEKLLSAAGWKPGPDGIRLKGSQRLAIRLLTTTDKPARALAAQIWRSQWRKAGIALDIEKQPANAIFGSSSSHGLLASGNFDLALIAAIARPDPDTTYRWRSNEVPPEGQNRGRYKSLEADRLVNAGQRTLDPAKRKIIYAKFAERLSADLPVVPLFYEVAVDATSARLEGFRPNPTLRGNLWNVWAWNIKP